MKKDIILCGVGGQGILSIATIIGQAATEAGLYLKQAEVHGMSQRGGDVQSTAIFLIWRLTVWWLPTAKISSTFPTTPMLPPLKLN